MRKRENFLKDRWAAICRTLHEFKYWFLEASLHEPLKLPKEADRNPTETPHRKFKELQSSVFPCDRCKNPARSVQYQCNDCDQGYCANCWPRTQRRGAHLSEQPSDPMCDTTVLVQEDEILETPRPVVSSYSDASPRQTSTGYIPLRHIEEGGFSFSLDNSAWLA